MDVLNVPALLIKCPHCGNKFNPEDSIGQHIREQLEKEFEGKIVNEGRSVEEKILGPLGPAVSSAASSPSF